MTEEVILDEEGAVVTSIGFCALGKRWSSWAIDCFNRESFGSKAAVRRALVTHVGLVGCFPSPMGDPQFRGKVWVDPDERLVGLGSFDFWTRGRIWAGEHESLCRACMVQEGVILAGWLMRGLVWALALVTRSLKFREFLTS